MCSAITPPPRLPSEVVRSRVKGEGDVHEAPLHVDESGARGTCDDGHEARRHRGARFEVKTQGEERHEEHAASQTKQRADHSGQGSGASVEKEIEGGEGHT
jgi:hypothetical protein